MDNSNNTFENVEGTFYPKDKNFLNPNCQHRSMINYMGTVGGKVYSVAGCLGCLKLLQKINVRDKNLIQ